jgi:hypothetical protein
MSHEVMCIGGCEVGDKMVDIEGYKCARQRGTTPSRSKKTWRYLCNVNSKLQQYGLLLLISV